MTTNYLPEISKAKIVKFSLLYWLGPLVLFFLHELIDSNTNWGNVGDSDNILHRSVMFIFIIVSIFSICYSYYSWYRHSKKYNIINLRQYTTTYFVLRLWTLVHLLELGILIEFLRISIMFFFNTDID